MLGDGGELAEKRLGDLAIRGDDDFAGFTVDHIERNLFTEEDVGKCLGEAFTQLVNLGFVFFLDMLDLATTIGRRQALHFVVDAGGNLDVHDDTGGAGRHHE